MLAFSLLASVSLAGCINARKTENNYLNNTSIESNYTESATSAVSSLEPEFTLLIDEYINSGKTQKEILESEDKSSVLYSSALYMKLREYGLDDETILKELFNVINFGLVHNYADGWKNDLLVENLNKSLNYSEDAIIYYYPLAVYVHLYNCNLEHEQVDNRIACDKIKEDLYSMDMLFENYVIENVLALDDNDPKKIAMMRIINSKEDTKTCVEELERIYELGANIGCVSEEDWATISHLNATLNQEENPFEVYYDLAVFAHTLGCDKEHTINEFGRVECDAIRKGMSY